MAQKFSLYGLLTVKQNLEFSAGVYGLEGANRLERIDEMIDHAIDFASEAHKGQKRKSGEAYITHPLHVSKTLVEWGMDSDSVIAGLLHDVAEDTEKTLDEIETLFGADVAKLVDGVTKVSRARAGMQDLGNYLPQTTDNLSKLLIAVGQDVRATDTRR